MLGTRDWPNAFHLYYEQLWPIYSLLAPWNLTNGDRPITAALMNMFELEQKDNGYEHALPTHSLVQVWEQIFNAPVLDLVGRASQQIEVSSPSALRVMAQGDGEAHQSPHVELQQWAER